MIKNLSFIFLLSTIFTLGLIPDSFCGNDKAENNDSEEDKNTFPLLKLPAEMVGQILRNKVLTIEDLTNVTLTCKTLSELAKDPLEKKQESRLKKLFSIGIVGQEAKRLEEMDLKTLKAVKSIVDFFSKEKRQNYISTLLGLSEEHFFIIQEAAPFLFSGSDKESVFSQLFSRPTTCINYEYTTVIFLPMCRPIDNNKELSALTPEMHNTPYSQPDQFLFPCWIKKKPLGKEILDPTPLINLANRLYHDMADKKKKNETAINIYRFLSDYYGYHDAQYRLGIMYWDGEGVPQNYERSHHYLQLSAAQNNSSALNCLGVAYAKGLGVEQNWETAFNYYKKAALKGISYAQFNLGFCYEHGLGVRANESMAQYLYELAEKQDINIEEGRQTLCEMFSIDLNPKDK